MRESNICHAVLEISMVASNYERPYQAWADEASTNHHYGSVERLALELKEME